MTPHENLAKYAAPGAFTQLGELATELSDLPVDAGSAAKFVQGLLLHDSMAAAYGATPVPEREFEKQIHSSASMLSRAKALSPLPLTVARAPMDRVRVVCRHFATLFVAVMRSKGIPSRVRCGFGRYFEVGKATDHWVGEYWSQDQSRWVLVDAQIDRHQREFFGIDFDTLDVPRDRFYVAGDAWRACLHGDDPLTYGVAGTANWGLVEIYGNIFQDLAALQNVELLPWGWYGLALDESGIREHELMNALADISSRADAPSLAKLAALLDRDPRLRVPAGFVQKILTEEAGR